MGLKDQIDADLKAAILAGDKTLVMTLRGLKSAILNVEIAENKREAGLGDEAIINLFQKEAKRRQESADLFAQGGNTEKAEAELTEKTVVEKYLPRQLDDAELTALIEEAIQTTGASGQQAMGQVIGVVKAKSGAGADGGRIAALVRKRLEI